MHFEEAVNFFFLFLPYTSDNLVLHFDPLPFPRPGSTPIIIVVIYRNKETDKFYYTICCKKGQIASQIIETAIFQNFLGNYNDADAFPTS